MSLNLARLHEWPIVGLDVETTGLHWYKDKLYGIAICCHDPDPPGIWGSSYYDIRKMPQILEALRIELPKSKLLVNHNLKFDLHFLRNEGIRHPARIDCTMVRAALLNEHEPGFSLDRLSKKYLGRSKVEPWDRLAKMFGGAPTREAQILNLARAPVEIAEEYAIVDPELAVLLWLHQEKMIKEQGLDPRILELEQKVLPVLIEMERHGVRIDEAYVEKTIPDINRKIREAQITLDKSAGKAVNANSPTQIRALIAPEQRDGEFYCGDYRLVKTSTGQPSMDADAMRALSERGHPHAVNILKLRKLTKARSFLTNHIQGHLHNGRVHTNFNQLKNDTDHGTITGRLSADDPALQQIPQRDDDMAAIVRAAFIPEPGEEWLCFDWKQFEFRMFAHYVRDADLLAAYQKDPETDFHQIVSDLTGIPRKPRWAGDANAKQINLGLVFGMGKGKMAAEMGLPYTIQVREIDGEEREFFIAGPEAEEVFAKYHNSIPGVKKILDQAGSLAKSRGYVLTVLGRRIRFPGGKFTHKAGGLVFQGSSADSMKQKLVEVNAAGNMKDFRLLMPIHDEYDISVPKETKIVIRDRLKKILEDFPNIRVPILADAQFGSNWYEASK